ncbi:SAF domain-containing protein [Streptomyces sp. KLOTTS4A1]|uniref:SAF domain-containing protein n=1 Tax=Streptomyces sp. KLOTTS4A1 TaxID=3390996 RepID=UPI0039F5CB4C
MDTRTSLPPQPQLGGGQRQPDLPISSGARKSVAPRSKLVKALAGVLVMVLGLLIVIMAVNRAGDRVPVLALAKDVQAGEEIEASDLVVASIAKDPVLSPIPASERSALEGQRAAVDLRKGSLLTRSQLQTGGCLGDDRQIVGIELKRGMAPRDVLRACDAVLAVVLPPQGGAGQGAKQDDAGAPPVQIEATVLSVGSTDASGAVVVNVAVAETDGPLLATKAAAKQVALIRQPRGSEQ